MKSNRYYAFLILSLYFITYTYTKPPQLTIIFVIDQFAYHYLPKLEKYLNGGIKHLLDNGVNYTNAYYPHAMPETATGHAALNTGTFAKDHGFIANSWFDTEGKHIECDDDNDIENTAVFAKEGLYNYGKSPKNIMVDGISDQLMLQSQSYAYNQVFALSLKSRAAISTANKLGKAIWFDKKTGFFTSSKAYFDQLPDWLVQFNKEKKVDQLKYVQWKSFYPQNSSAYAFYNINNYSFARHSSSILSRDIPIRSNITLDNAYENDYKLYNFFQLTPHANQLLLDLAKECIQQNLTTQKDDKFLLWISLSSLDKIGHKFGPESMEVIDMIYHLDHQIKQFMHFVHNQVNQEDVLFVLTADHGVDPIPELLHKQNFKPAFRIIEEQLIQKINTLIHTKYNLTNLVAIKNQQVFLKKTIFTSLEITKQKTIINEIKIFLKQQPGIKNVWTFDELMNTSFEPHAIEAFFKKQLYPGRSGLLTFQTFPYSFPTRHEKGTGHKTPYEWNTHVPLIFYQKGTFENKRIHTRIWMLQVANTLAHILNIPKPSASTFELLPGLIEE